MLRISVQMGFLCIIQCSWGLCTPLRFPLAAGTPVRPSVSMCQPRNWFEGQRVFLVCRTRMHIDCLSSRLPKQGKPQLNLEILCSTPEQQAALHGGAKKSKRAPFSPAGRLARSRGRRRGCWPSAALCSQAFVFYFAFFLRNVSRRAWRAAACRTPWSLVAFALRPAAQMAGQAGPAPIARGQRPSVVLQRKQFVMFFTLLGASASLRCFQSTLLEQVLQAAET